MAETVVTAVIGDAVSRAISLLTGRFAAQQSAEAKLRRICHTLIRIQSAVEEARGRHITNDGVLRWLSELIAGEHQGRYLLDTIPRGDHKDDYDGDDRRDDEQQVVPLRRAASSVSSLFNPAKRVRVAAACAVKKMALSRCDDLAGGANAGEIDSVLESLLGVSGDLAEFILLLQGYQPVIRRPLATNIFVDGQMFGRHVEKQRIINFLLHDGGGSGGREDLLGVLPIVGDVGAGKTTLVQHSCDDDRVRRHFAVIVFLSFSCTYATATSQETAIVSLRSKHVICGDGDAQLSLIDDPLQWIERNSNGQRFLIVFEDVDMRKKPVLEELLLKLKKSSAGQGSKVIFTTANRRVSTLGTVEPIRVKFLPNPEYWFFFKAHAFAGRDLEENPRLVAAGKAIAKKLNGSFFGAKIVGGLLKDHPDPKFWCKVLRSDIGGLSLLGDGIFYIADLSQNLLPDHVDVCQVDVSKAPFAEQIELPRFQDLCEAPPGWETAGLADGIGSVRVLLCKSVMPFHISTTSLLALYARGTAVTHALLLLRRLISCWMISD